jgi:hypothetical protein
MKFLFGWWHEKKLGRALLKDVAVARHRKVCREAINMLFDRGPLLGTTRIEHRFNDYYISTRRPVGTWRVVVEQVEPPPDGEVVPFIRKTE